MWKPRMKFIKEKSNSFSFSINFNRIRIVRSGKLPGFSLSYTHTMFEKLIQEEIIFMENIPPAKFYL